jgi:non-heme chloroperoxidase
MRVLGAIENVTVVGFSMGGSEVARYMSRHGGKGVVWTAMVSSVVPYMLKTSDNPDGTPQGVFDGIGDGIQKDGPTFSEARSSRSIMVTAS